MKILALALLFMGGLLFVAPAGAQTFARSPAPASDAAQLEMLVKKIDEQNAKIDTLSQQILRLEQQITSMRPGVMVGEATPAPTAAPASSSATDASARTANGNAHTVARGETL